MRKAIIIFLISMQIGALNAQISLDHSYNNSTSVVKFETIGYKYFLMDVSNSQCRIYNLNHSLYTTINCSVPNNCYLADIKFLSENLFDNDSGIELLYTWYEYIETQTSYYYEYDSKIINEDGTSLLNIEGAQYNYINQTEESTYKLFSYCFDYSNFPEEVWTNIYNLSGIPILSAVFDENNPEILLNAFPNPAANSLKVTYFLPENIDTGILQLFDNSGRPVNQFVVDHYSDHLDLDVSEMASGVYHYFIEYNNTRTNSMKIVVR